MDLLRRWLLGGDVWSGGSSEEEMVAGMIWFTFAALIVWGGSTLGLACRFLIRCFASHLALMSFFEWKGVISEGICVALSSLEKLSIRDTEHRLALWFLFSMWHS